MIDAFTARYLWALGVTVGVELPLVTALAWRLGGRPAYTAGVALGANLLTHGTLWTVFWWVPGPYPVQLVLCESAVVAAEAAIYARFGVFSPRVAVAVSLAVNLLTTVIGLVSG